MSEPKPTIGRAIDQIVEALGAFDEGDQRTILSTVCAHLKITLGVAASPVGTRMTSGEENRAGVSSDIQRTHDPKKHGEDIRTLKDQKQPSSARQMACLVAYYLLEHAPETERKAAITTADLEKYFKQANFKLPTKLEQVLVDSK